MIRDFALHDVYCNHPFEDRAEYGNAFIPADGDAINNDRPIKRIEAQICLACNTVLVYDGALVDSYPQIYPSKIVRCRHQGCQKILTQSYAINMGECIEHCLKRIRSDLGRGFMIRA